MYYKGMYQKHRLYIQTSRGSHAVASGDSLDELPGKAQEWLDGTSAGRSVYDDQARAVVLYNLAKDGKSYEFGQKLATSDRLDIIEKVKQL